MKKWQNPKLKELGIESTEKGPDNNHVLDATSYEDNGDKWYSYS